MYQRKAKDCSLAIVGLGYVGLPLALAFGKKYKTFGFDLDRQKILDYQNATDRTGECSPEDFRQAEFIRFSDDPAEIRNVDIVIVAVPTPIDSAKKPDLNPLQNACKIIGNNLGENQIIVFESTVYPGTTEEFCIPIIEKTSERKNLQDFVVGYSPERINPGDREHTIESIIKVVAAQTNEATKLLAEIYGSIVTAGIHVAENIKTAEAAKIIENTQRDLNIALMNELAIIFDRLEIDTAKVLEAASTKWNFLKFTPGLVGGHCIGVDPYYLTYRAEQIGYHPQVILAGRRINDNMGKYIAEVTIKKLANSDQPIKDSNVLILGITFKPNCRDIRNSKVLDIISELQDYGVNVFVHDPLATKKEVWDEYGIELIEPNRVNDISAIIAAVNHDEILNLDFKVLKNNARSQIPFIDVKSAFDQNYLSSLNYEVWRL